MLKKVQRQKKEKRNKSGVSIPSFGSRAAILCFSKKWEGQGEECVILTTAVLGCRNIDLSKYLNLPMACMFALYIKLIVKEVTNV